MAFSRSLTFTEPDHYQSALRAMRADVIVSGKGGFRAHLTRVNFSKLWIQSGSDNLPRVAFVANDPARAPIFLQTDSSQSAIVISGKELSPGEMVVFREGETHINRSVGPHSWGAMSLDPEALANAGRLIAGRELAFPPNTYSARPAPALLSRLTHIHRRATQLAAESPDRLGHAEVARALEQTLIYLMIRCITDKSGSNDRICNPRHKAIIRKFEELLIENPHQPFYLAEVCAATGSTERTLLRCCQDQFGMGPIRLLWLRRMNMVRAALSRGDAVTSSVTKIAMAHGFWELGRFAVSYREIYGESPSQTLVRKPAMCPPLQRPLPRQFCRDLAGTA